MGRKKIQIKRLVDDRNRAVTFQKRKSGLMKKAWELSVLCAVDIAVVVLGDNDRVFEFCNANIDDVIIRYTQHTGPIDHKSPTTFANAASNDAAGDSDDEDDEELLIKPTRKASVGSNKGKKAAASTSSALKRRPSSVSLAPKGPSPSPDGSVLPNIPTLASQVPTPPSTTYTPSQPPQLFSDLDGQRRDAINVARNAGYMLPDRAEDSDQQRVGQTRFDAGPSSSDNHRNSQIAYQAGQFSNQQSSYQPSRSLPSQPPHQINYFGQNPNNLTQAGSQPSFQPPRDYASNFSLASLAGLGSFGLPGGGMWGGLGGTNGMQGLLGAAVLGGLDPVQQALFSQLQQQQQQQHQQQQQQHHPRPHPTQHQQQHQQQQQHPMYQHAMFNSLPPQSSGFSPIGGSFQWPITNNSNSNTSTPSLQQMSYPPNPRDSLHLPTGSYPASQPSGSPFRDLPIRPSSLQDQTWSAEPSPLSPDMASLAGGGGDDMRGFATVFEQDRQADGFIKTESGRLPVDEGQEEEDDLSSEKGSEDEDDDDGRPDGSRKRQGSSTSRGSKRSRLA